MKQDTKDLGVWMDHANAFLTEFTVAPMTTRTLASAFTHQDKIASMAKSELLSHNKEQHEHAAYYKQLSEIIANYDSVVLFGPTDAKSELINILKANHRFDKIMIEVRPADKMTEHEQQLFVKNHFASK